jgi:hypothetical protein
MLTAVVLICSAAVTHDLPCSKEVIALRKLIKSLR